MKMRLSAIPRVAGSLVLGAAIAWFFSMTASGQQPPTIPSGNADAQRTAQRFLDRLLFKCGDSHFVVFNRRGGGGLGLFEYRDVSSRLAATTLSAADRLNGYEWVGELRISAVVARERDVIAREWLPWYSRSDSQPAIQIVIGISKMKDRPWQGHVNGWGSSDHIGERPIDTFPPRGSCKEVAGIHSRSGGDPIDEALDGEFEAIQGIGFVPVDPDDVAVFRCRCEQGSHENPRRRVASEDCRSALKVRDEKPVPLPPGTTVRPVFCNPELGTADQEDNYVTWPTFARWPTNSAQSVKWVLARLSDGRLGAVTWSGEARFGDFFERLTAEESHGKRGRGNDGVSLPDPGTGARSANRQVVEADGTEAQRLADVLKPGPGVTGPVAISKVEPQYTEEGRRAKLEGTVLLTGVVDVDGRAKNLTVKRGIGSGLDEEAIKAIQQWRFVPAKKDGRPVPVRVSIEVNFRLLKRH